VDQETQERVDLLEDARESIFQAVELIRQATEDTPAWGRVRSYLVPALEMAAREGHQWLGSNQANIDAVIADLMLDA
jgi:hypothetical protein